MTTEMPGIMIVNASNLDATLSYMGKITNDWTMKAARGECGWICSDCCGSDHTGMPNECFHGLEWCTKIIQRDKKAANNL